MMSLSRHLALIGLLWIASIAAALSAEAAPRRVVSFNLCADQLVVALADPEQIAGLSPYAADPALSVVAAQARRFRRLDWQAEATIALQPDLVLVGPNDRPVTRRLLMAQGLRVIDVALVSDLAGARAQITELAALLGHPERGGRLIAALAAAQARLASVPRPAYSTALVVERGGYIAGAAESRRDADRRSRAAAARGRALGIRRLHSARAPADAQGRTSCS